MLYEGQILQMLADMKDQMKDIKPSQIVTESKRLSTATPPPESRSGFAIVSKRGTIPTSEWIRSRLRAGIRPISEAANFGLRVGDNPS